MTRCAMPPCSNNGAWNAACSTATAASRRNRRCIRPKGRSSAACIFPATNRAIVFSSRNHWRNCAESQGVSFALDTRIERLEADGDRITRVHTDQGALTADACVLACGSYSPLLARPLGIRLPVYPVKGYSITLPLIDAEAAPSGSVTDVTYKVVITRLGDKLRGAGTAELAGYDLSLPPSRLATISHVMADLFPGAGDPAQAQPWCGLRPMTPDNPPGCRSHPL